MMGCGISSSVYGATKNLHGFIVVGSIVVYYVLFLSAAFYTVCEICERSSIQFSVLKSTYVPISLVDMMSS